MKGSILSVLLILFGTLVCVKQIQGKLISGYNCSPEMILMAVLTSQVSQPSLVLRGAQNSHRAQTQMRPALVLTVSGAEMAIPSSSDLPPSSLPAFTIHASNVVDYSH